MNKYRVLNKQVYESGDYSIVPIRMKDRYMIMKWRNEQIYHLRQEKPLTKAEQDKYFKNVVSKLFEKDKPEQILFSYLEKGKCIGYGGLVHINWTDKNAEISFIMKTELEKDNFEKHWSNFLNLIENVAFEELNSYKVYTYAFDLRPKLYKVLEKKFYYKEAILKNHCFFNDEYKDVIIHSKITPIPYIRKATATDINTTFQWVNNKEIRKYSINKQKVSFNRHKQWFISKITAKDCVYLILQQQNKTLGSIRFDIDNKKRAKISYLINPEDFGKGYGTTILKKGEEYIRNTDNKIKEIYGIVFNDNAASIKIFKKLEYKFKILDEKCKMYYKRIK